MCGDDECGFSDIKPYHLSDDYSKFYYSQIPIVLVRFSFPY